MMKTRSDLDSALALLDDPSDPMSNSSWTQLTRERLNQRPQTAEPAPQAQAAPQRPSRSEAVEEKVFRNDTTLRKMMGEYNRQTTRLSQIQKPAITPQELSHGFRFDRVAFIQIPNIPGRVLRPTTASDDADA